jgi:integrase
MASIKPISSKGGIKWKVLIRRKGEPHIGKTFDTREEAEAFAYITENKVLAAIMPKHWNAPALNNEPPPEIAAPATEGRANVCAIPPAAPISIAAATPAPVGPNLDAESLADIVANFMKRARAKEKYSSLAPTVIREVGDITVGEINNDWIADYILKMRSKKSRIHKQFSYNTIKKHMTVMKKAIEWRAATLRVFCPPFPFNISDDFPRDYEQARNRRLSAAEEQRLTARLSRIQGPSRDHWVLLVEFARHTCARLQELLLAEWAEFTPNGDGWIIPRNHTKAFDERSVPFGAGAKETYEKLVMLKNPDDPRVFHTLGTPSVVSSNFVRYVKEAGISNFRFHDLRHEAVTRLALLNPADSTSVMKVSGHKYSEIFDRYVNPTMKELSARLILP